MFDSYIKARYPVLMVVSPEEARVELELANTLKELKWKVVVWSHTDGFIDSNGKVIDEVDDPVSALQKIRGAESTGTFGEKVVFLFRDLHPFFGVPKIARLIRDIAREFKTAKKTLIMISPLNELPVGLQRDVTLLEFGLPERAIIGTMIDRFVSENKTVVGDVAKDEVFAIVEACMGLTTVEAENAMAKGVVDWKKGLKEDAKSKVLISTLVMSEKANAIKKSGVLEWYPAKQGMDDIGGLVVLKEWLSIRKLAFTEDARKYGLPAPRGVMLTGIPGTGKSLAAKACAANFGVPLIKFDVGRVFGGLVGQSEANMRIAIQTAEAVGRCLPGDTLVTMADGTEKRIDQIAIGERVACFDERTGKIVTTKIIATRTKMGDTIELATSGDTLRSTPDHEHMTLRDGKAGFKRADEFHVGDLLAMPIRFPNKTVSTFEFLPDNVLIYGVDRKDKRVPKDARYATPYVYKRDMSEDEWLSKPVHRIATGSGWSHTVIERMPSKVTHDLAYALGLVMSDGHVRSDFSHVGFTNAKGELHEAFAGIVQDLGLNPITRESEVDERYESYKQLPGISANPQLSTIYVTRVNSTLFARIVRKMQDKVLALRSDLLEYWLAGYVDGDGSIGEDKVVICSKQQANAHMVRRVLQRIGIVPPKWNDRVIEITGQRGKLIAAKLMGKVRHPAKAMKLECLHFLLRHHLSGRDSGFHICEALRSKREAAGLSTNDLGISSSEVWRLEHGYLTSERNLRRVNESLHDADFQFLLDSDVRWVPVETINRSGEEVVYDIQCEGNPTHNFIANGVVSHNCVLWVDEIEKAFAGMSSSGQTDSGVSARVFGSFITWMQEKTAPVFIVATCNKIDGLPPELLRKGRFDEIFYVDLPDEKEREEILKIHITKRGRDPKKFDAQGLKECASNSEGYSGAELEEAVISGLYTGFYRKEELNDMHILSAIMRTVPLSRSRRGDLESMKKWASDFAQNANHRKDEEKKSREVDA